MERTSATLRRIGAVMISFQTKSEQIDVLNAVGRLLLLRASLAQLRQTISESRSHGVTLDFPGVEFMSQSSGDEYRAANTLIGKQIVERAVSPEVKKMLDRVVLQIALGESQAKSIRRAVRRPSAKVL